METEKRWLGTEVYLDLPPSIFCFGLLTYKLIIPPLIEFFTREYEEDQKP